MKEKMTAFSEWKLRTMRRLVELSKNYSDLKAAQTLHYLISRLDYLRARDLASFLYLLYQAAVDVKETLDLVPSESELAAIVKEDRR